MNVLAFHEVFKTLPDEILKDMCSAYWECDDEVCQKTHEKAKSFLAKRLNIRPKILRRKTTEELGRNLAGSINIAKFREFHQDVIRAWLLLRSLI